MAAIRETLTLVDQFSGTISKYIQKMQQANTTTKEMQDASRRVQAAARAQTAAMNAAAASARAESAALRLQEQQQRATASATDSMTRSIRNLVGAFAGIQTVKWLVNTSDQLTSINARLRLMTGSAEAAAAAQEEIYQAAMRSRGAYADMADFVSQLGTVAGNAFTGTDELVAFAEQIQKQMAISGASGASAQAALVQLTQGLASGTLRGEELNSVLEQTPMIAQTIAEYMGVTTGEMRELASEGKVTAEVVKNAMLGAAEETNAQFEQMPMTWAQVWTMFQNVAIHLLVGKPLGRARSDFGRPGRRCSRLCGRSWDSGGCHLDCEWCSKGFFYHIAHQPPYLHRTYYWPGSCGDLSMGSVYGRIRDCVAYCGRFSALCLGYRKGWFFHRRILRHGFV